MCLCQQQHLAESRVERQGDGSYRLILKAPCTDTNAVKFGWELERALDESKRLAHPVWWIHNGIRVDTDCEQSGGAWAFYTEKNAETGN